MDRQKLTQRELWLMQQAWDMATASSERGDGWESMEAWLSSIIGRDGWTAKNGLELCAPSIETDTPVTRRITF